MRGHRLTFQPKASRIVRTLEMITFARHITFLDYHLHRRIQAGILISFTMSLRPPLLLLYNTTTIADNISPAMPSLLFHFSSMPHFDTIAKRAHEPDLALYASAYFRQPSMPADASASNAEAASPAI